MGEQRNLPVGAVGACLPRWSRYWATIWGVMLSMGALLNTLRSTRICRKFSAWVLGALVGTISSS